MIMYDCRMLFHQIICPHDNSVDNNVGINNAPSLEYQNVVAASPMGSSHTTARGYVSGKGARRGLCILQL